MTPRCGRAIFPQNIRPWRLSVSSVTSHAFSRSALSVLDFKTLRRRDRDSLSAHPHAHGGGARGYRPRAPTLASVPAGSRDDRCDPKFRCAHRAHCDRSPSGSPVCLHRLKTPTVARRRFVQDVAARATVIAAVSATRIVTAAGTVHDGVRAADRGRNGLILTVVTRPSSYRTNINTHSPRSPA